MERKEKNKKGMPNRINARLNGLEFDINSLRDSFYHTEADFKDIFRKHYQDIAELRSEINTLKKQNEAQKELINVLFDAMNIITQSVNSSDKQ
ncbi:MAG: hypothetical protein QW478_10050 [Candidatus Micrarchaeaceae archaeon]